MDLHALAEAAFLDGQGAHGEHLDRDADAEGEEVAEQQGQGDGEENPDHRRHDHVPDFHVGHGFRDLDHHAPAHVGVLNQEDRGHHLDGSAAGGVGVVQGGDGAGLEVFHLLEHRRGRKVHAPAHDGAVGMEDHDPVVVEEEHGVPGRVGREEPENVGQAEDDGHGADLDAAPGHGLGEDEDGFRVPAEIRRDEGAGDVRAGGVGFDALLEGLAQFGVEDRLSGDGVARLQPDTVAADHPDVQDLGPGELEQVGDEGPGFGVEEDQGWLFRIEFQLQVLLDGLDGVEARAEVLGNAAGHRLADLGMDLALVGLEDLRVVVDEGLAAHDERDETDQEHEADQQIDDPAFPALNADVHLAVSLPRGGGEYTTGAPRPETPRRPQGGITPAKTIWKR